MTEQLVRYLTIGQVLQKEITDKLEHNNQSYSEWCAKQKRKKKKLFYLTLHDNIHNIEYFQNVCITTQPYHSHVCC